MSCIEPFYVFFLVVLLSFKIDHRPKENAGMLFHTVQLKKCFVGHET